MTLMPPSRSEPLTFVIFGATGDLFQRKIIPALFDLFCRDVLPHHFYIVGVARRDLGPEAFHALLSSSLEHRTQTDTRKRAEFLTHARYHQGLFDDKEHYARLKDRLAELDKEIGRPTNKLLYLAVPPTLYDVILTNLRQSKLSVPEKGADAWTRILIEKPFGRDTATAEELDRRLGTLFNEEQIFRIDHYLAKETIQNILTFRFGNAFFEPIWNKKHIRSVHVGLYEAEDVATRGAFFDGVGALRDVGQNHLLQMLALIAMETPKQLSSKDIRENRSAVMKKLTLFKSPAESIVRAQYRGFKDEKGVAKDSETETYFKVVAGVKNGRWRGVPFILESGKALAEAKVEITVYLRADAVADLTESNEQECYNSLTFHIQPTEGISIVFWVKKPGFNLELERRPLSFRYTGEDVLPDAYERVLMDAIRGDQTLFASTDEVKAEWAFMTPLLKKMKQVPLIEYEKGAKAETIKMNYSNS